MAKEHANTKTKQACSNQLHHSHPPHNPSGHGADVRVVSVSAAIAFGEPLNATRSLVLNPV